MANRLDNQLGMGSQIQRHHDVNVSNIVSTQKSQKEIPSWLNQLDVEIGKLERNVEMLESILVETSNKENEKVENKMCGLANELRIFTLRIEAINRVLENNQL